MTTPETGSKISVLMFMMAISGRDVRDLGQVEKYAIASKSVPTSSDEAAYHLGIVKDVHSGLSAKACAKKHQTSKLCIGMIVGAFLYFNWPDDRNFSLDQWRNSPLPENPDMRWLALSDETLH